MTLSLVHVHPSSGTVAALTATGGVAVGGYVHHVWRGLGACATQGLATNPWYPEGIQRALADGHGANEALNGVVQEDDGASRRQCLVMDGQGQAAVHHGTDNVDAVAACLRPTVAAAGNMLADAAVVDVMVDAFAMQTCHNFEAVRLGISPPDYRENYASNLPEVLLHVLGRALEAGGDKRGVRSCALRIESFSAAPIDLRVDWCEGDLVAELRALIRRVRAAEFSTFLSSLPMR